jgi:hypothetical protein
MITQEAGQSCRDFPLQVPTGPDHMLWLKMIHSLTQAGNRLMRPLGRYIGAPHRPDVWFLSKTLSSFFFKVDSGGHDVYALNQTPHLTRYGTTYTYSHHNAGPCVGSTTCNHHQLAGSHHKTFLITSLLVTTTLSQTKLIAGNPSIMGKLIHLKTS